MKLHGHDFVDCDGAGQASALSMNFDDCNVDRIFRFVNHESNVSLVLVVELKM